MAAKSARGRIVWHELVTPDSNGSQAFYQQTVGWKVQAWEHNPDYSMFAVGSGPLGGVVAQADQPPHWRHYIATDDLDATVQRASALGASVIVQPEALPDGGRYAVLTDPQGATFAAFQSAQRARPDKPAKPGEFSWHELATTDAPAALEFYSQLFGWEQTAAHDMGPIGTYYIFAHNGRDIGGVFNKTPDMPGPSAWLGYVRVKNIDKVVKKVKKAGGTLVNGPMEVPGGDWIAQFADPQGAMFAVHALHADLHPAAAAAEPAPAPAPIEVTAAPPEQASTESAPRSAGSAKKKASAKPAARSTPKAGKAGGSTRTKAAGKSKASRKAVKAKAKAKSTRRAAKTTKRPARKAAKVRSRVSKAAASSRGKARAGKKKTSARPRKGK